MMMIQQTRKTQINLNNSYCMYTVLTHTRTHAEDDD